MRKLESLVDFMIGNVLTQGFFGKLWILALGGSLSWHSTIKARILECDLVAIGENSGIEADVSPASVYPTCLVLKKIRIEKGSWIGVRAIIEPGATLPKNCKLDDLSFVPRALQEMLKV